MHAGCVATCRRRTVPTFSSQAASRGGTPRVFLLPLRSSTRRRARHGDTAWSAEAGLSRLDRELERQASAGAPHPLFGGEGAARPLSADVALDMVGNALGASALQRPSPSLIRLIRAGKLVDVGRAIPRALEGYAMTGGAAS